jgi:hypothetical protein
MPGASWTQSPVGGDPIRVFYSYSHKDRRLLDELGMHLCMLKREGLIEEWHDQQTDPGDVLDECIREQLDTADLILPLVSQHFLASDVCYVHETQIALERHRRGEARVVPVILRPADWRSSDLGHLKALPTDGRPVVTWRHRAIAWQNVVAGLRAVVDEVRGYRHGPRPSRDTPPIGLGAKHHTALRNQRIALSTVDEPDTADNSWPAEPQPR